MGWGDFVGHASYIVLAISYLLTNILWLRVAACVGIFLEVVYFIASGGSNLVTGIVWGVIFISINVWQLYVLVKDRWGFDLAHSDRWLLRRSFVGLDDAQLSRLARTGRWVEFEPGKTIMAEGQPVDSLAVIFNGAATVRIGDGVVGQLDVGDLIGEVAFLTGSRASASVSAGQMVRVLAFDRTQLATLCSKDGQIASAVYHLIGRELARKMVLSNARNATEAAA